jgi:hypothetical protein
MKQRIQGIIIGILISALLFSTVVMAAPATVWKKIDVAYGSYKIYVDGVLFEAKDNNGVIEPFSYNGWIYAPFEHIARALGKEVSWDGNTHSLYLFNKSTGVIQYIGTDLKAYQSGNYREYSLNETGDYFVMAGVKYYYGCRWNSTINNWAGGYSIYNLNGQYRTITGVLGHIDGTEMRPAKLQIFYDGVLNREIELTGDMIPKEITLDVRGVKQLKITVDYSPSTLYGFGNPVIK